MATDDFFAPAIYLVKPMASAIDAIQTNILRNRAFYVLTMPPGLLLVLAPFLVAHLVFKAAKSYFADDI